MSESPAPPLPRSAAVTFFATRGWRFALMILLTLLMGVPLLMVLALIEDRASYQRHAVGEVSEHWGGPVRLGGPVLVIPVEREVSRMVENDDGTRRRERRTEWAKPLILLPETLEITVDAATQIRRRGIFEVPVYTSNFQLSARFDTDRLNGAAASGETVLWNRAALAMVMPGYRSFSGKAHLGVDGRPVDLDPGTPLPDAAPRRADTARPAKKIDLSLEPGTPFAGISGIHALIGDPRGRTTYRLEMGLNGAREMMVSPVGRQTEITMNSDWPHPSFQGAFLPKIREISAEGFTAGWSVPHLARDMTQVSRGNWRPVGHFGVSFYNPVDLYQKSGRAAKYGILFIALTFLTVFLMERFAARPVHAAQFVLIGIAQCVFFLLLLSISEQIGFGPAYLVASGATIALIGLYGWSGLALGRRAMILVGALAVLYATLFLILRSADYALLAGSVLAFIAVALAMLMTRGEDWSGGSPSHARA